MNAIVPLDYAGIAVRSELDAAVARDLSLALTRLEAAVLRLTFGIDGTPCPLLEAARRLGLRPAAARQLQRRAMRALRRAALHEGDPTD